MVFLWEAVNLSYLYFNVNILVFRRHKMDSVLVSGSSIKKILITLFITLKIWRPGNFMKSWTSLNVFSDNFLYILYIKAFILSCSLSRWRVPSTYDGMNSMMIEKLNIQVFLLMTCCGHLPLGNLFSEDVLSNIALTTHSEIMESVFLVSFSLCL